MRGREDGSPRGDLRRWQGWASALDPTGLLIGVRRESQDSLGVFEGSLKAIHSEFGRKMNLSARKSISTLAPEGGTGQSSRQEARGGQCWSEQKCCQSPPGGASQSLRGRCRHGAGGQGARRGGPYGHTEVTGTSLCCLGGPPRSPTWPEATSPSSLETPGSLG